MGHILGYIQYIKTLSSVSVWNVTHDKCLFQNVELKGNVLTCFDELEKVLHLQNDLWYLWPKFLKTKIDIFVKTNPLRHILKIYSILFEKLWKRQIGLESILNDSFSQSDFRKRLTVVKKEKIAGREFLHRGFLPRHFFTSKILSDRNSSSCLDCQFLFTAKTHFSNSFQSIRKWIQCTRLKTNLRYFSNI